MLDSLSPDPVSPLDRLSEPTGQHGVNRTSFTRNEGETNDEGSGYGLLEGVGLPLP
jgi:hypothetical protein